MQRDVLQYQFLFQHLMRFASQLLYMILQLHKLLLKLHNGSLQNCVA